MPGSLMTVMCAGFFMAALLRTGEAGQPDPLDGVWQIESNRSNGRDTPREQLEGSNLAFTAEGQFTFSVGPLTTMHGKVEFPPNTEPKAIDLLPTNGIFKGKKLLGVYCIRRKRLTLCYAEPGEARPKDFQSEAKAKTTLMTLSRDEDKAD